MSWDISIYSGSAPDSSLLGPQSEVIAKLIAALPGVHFGLSLAPSDEMLAMMPPTLRELAANPGLEGEFDHPDFNIQFSSLNEDPLRFINCEVRGDGDPTGALRALCESTGWQVWDSVESKQIDFTKLEESSWAAFCTWRDRAFSEMDNQP